MKIFGKLGLDLLVMWIWIQLRLGPLLMWIGIELKVDLPVWGIWVLVVQARQDGAYDWSLHLDSQVDSHLLVVMGFLQVLVVLNR